MKRIVGVLLMAGLAGCVADHAPTVVDDEAVAPVQTGMFRVVAGQLQPVDALDGVTVDGNQVTIDWLRPYTMDTLRLFYIDTARSIQADRMVEIEIDQVFTDDQGEAKSASAICFSELAVPAPMDLLQLALGLGGNASAMPTLGFSLGGFRHSSAGWHGGPGQDLDEGFFAAAAVSGVQGVQWDDEDHLTHRLTITGDYRLIELPTAPALCGPHAGRFEQGPVWIPGTVVDGGSFSLESAYGAYVCAGPGVGGSAEGSGTVEVNGVEEPFDGSATVRLQGPPIAEARISVDEWQGDMNWGLVGWPNVFTCHE